MQPHEVVEQLQDELLVVGHEAAAVETGEHGRQHFRRLGHVQSVPRRQAGRQQLRLLPQGAKKFRVEDLYR